MSRYGIDAFLREINMIPASYAAYVSDPEAFVTAWTLAPLTAPERDALSTRDFGTLYGMGAHPYLLWSFTEAVWVPELTRPDLVERFRVAARSHGYPDVAT